MEKIIINYGLNPDRTFNFWQLKPIVDHLPKLEVDDPRLIILGKTKLIDGIIVKPEEDDTEIIRKNREQFNLFRKKLFQALDVYEKNVFMGREQPDASISVAWYNSMLSFPEKITRDTTRGDYPIIPTRLKYYLGG